MRTHLAIKAILFLWSLCVSAVAQANTTLCQCSPNSDSQLIELHCLHDAHTSPPVADIDLLIRSNCSYYKLEVAHFDLGSIHTATFHTVPHLTHVNLSSTYIKTIDRKAFRVLTYLTGVDLTDNGLLTIDSDLFIDNPDLKAVSLSDNPLELLATDTSILKSDSITELDLSFCKLTRVTAAMFAGLPHLQRLNLSSNKLQRVPPGMLLMMPRLTFLDVSSNRGECACLLKEILGYGQKVGEEALPTLYCYAPPSDVYWPSRIPKEVCADDVATTVTPGEKTSQRSLENSSSPSGKVVGFESIVSQSSSLGFERVAFVLCVLFATVVIFGIVVLLIKNKICEPQK